MLKKTATRAVLIKMSLLKFTDSIMPRKVNRCL